MEISVAKLNALRGGNSQPETYTQYNGSGYPLEMVDANNSITHYQYDLRNRLTAVTLAVGTNVEATTAYGYDNVGNLISITQANGVVTYYDYDKAYRLTDIRDSDGNKIHLTLDKAGNIKSQTIEDPSGTLRYSQTQNYDQLSRLKATLGNDGQVQNLDYDANDNRKTLTDSYDRSTEQVYDALDRITQVTARDTGTTGFDYDAQDRLTRVTDPRGLTTEYQYNAFGDLVRQISPDTGTTKYNYDSAGNRVLQKDARGQVITYRYDQLNRLTHIFHSGASAEDIRYVYDLGQRRLGRLYRVFDASGVTEYSYDKLGRPNQILVTRDGVGYLTEYRFDLAGNIQRIYYPSGRIVDYTLDAQARPQKVTTKKADGEPVEQVARNISYLPFGPMSGYKYGNNINHSLAYDPDYRLTGLVSQGTSTVLNRSYDYDLNNNVEWIDDQAHSAHSQLFGYDEEDRLTSASGGYGSLSYGYDQVGNRTSSQHTDTTTAAETYFTTTSATGSTASPARAP